MKRRLLTADRSAVDGIEVRVLDSATALLTIDVPGIIVDVQDKIVRLRPVQGATAEQMADVMRDCLEAGAAGVKALPILATKAPSPDEDSERAADRPEATVPTFQDVRELLVSMASKANIDGLVQYTVETFEGANVPDAIDG